MQKSRQSSVPSPPTIKQFSLKCQLTLQKNNLPYSINSKGKLHSLILRPPRKLIITPYAKADILIEFDIASIRCVHRRFIDEGKLTIEILEGFEIVNVLSTDLSFDRPLKKEFLTHIFINNSIRQSLELFLQKLNAMLDILKKENKPEKLPSKKQVLPQKSEPQAKLKKKQPSRRDNIRSALEQQKEIEVDRRQRQFQQKPTKSIIPFGKVSVAPKPRRLLFQVLPIDVLQLIIEYVGGCPLELRILNKKIAGIILKSIRKIKLKDEIDEETFKILTPQALQISCRMKNIKDISHLGNLVDDGPLEQHNSRWLRFGKWKEITSKNIDQLKGIRIYCLEIPYTIKFQTKCLIGLKLAGLKLKGNKNAIQPRNAQVSDGNLALLLNHFDQIKIFEVGCIGQGFFGMLREPQRLNVLKIGTLQIVKNSTYDWTDFRKFSGLKQFGLKFVVDHYGKPMEILEEQVVKLPLNITKLKLGSYINLSSFEDLPQNLVKLSLAGRRIVDQLILNIQQPNLKTLDIRACPNLTWQALLNFHNITVKLKWPDYVIDSCRPFFFERCIHVINQKVMQPNFRPSTDFN